MAMDDFGDEDEVCLSVYLQIVTIDIKDGCSLVYATHLLVKSHAECFHCNHFGVYIGHCTLIMW